jgi:ATP-dependent DNA helicase RecQ
LEETVRYRPRDEQELSRISGVGAVKLEQRYGTAFLKLLGEHEAEHGRPENLPPLPRHLPRPPAESGRTRETGMSDTVHETLSLLRKGLSPAEIAVGRDLKESTVYGHLARCIEEGELSLSDVVDRGSDERRAIETAFCHLSEDSPYALKPVFETFDGKYDYGLLRCVRAAMGF